ncbi:MAG: hypothetical protein MJ231_05665 [bacterium]|nr:hypothetical protein [bacterium]
MSDFDQNQKKTFIAPFRGLDFGTTFMSDSEQIEHTSDIVTKCETL